MMLELVFVFVKIWLQFHDLGHHGTVSYSDCGCVLYCIGFVFYLDLMSFALSQSQQQLRRYVIEPHLYVMTVRMVQSTDSTQPTLISVTIKLKKRDFCHNFKSNS